MGDQAQFASVGRQTLFIFHRMPDGMQTFWIDASNGFLTGEGCPNARLLPFISGSQPRQSTNCTPRPSGVKDWFQSLFGG